MGVDTDRGQKTNWTIDWARVLRTLDAFYRRKGGRKPVLRERGVNPFHVLVSTILSQRTRDEVTERAALRLLARYPTVTALSRAPVSRIRVLIAGVGFPAQKATALRVAAKEILVKYHGVLPTTLETLKTLPRVGTKTANAILVFGFQVPAIPVDTHIHRVVNRIGVVHTRSYEETTTALETIVPVKLWGRINPTLVQHGQNLCRAVHPKCPECPILSSCLRVGLGSST